nr:translation initiation factor IF-2-like [Aegilops tauschii subsp. strangulata]
MPSRPSSSMPSWQIPQAAPVPPVAKPSAPATKSSAPVHLATCQRTTGISIASGASASSSAPPQPSTGPTLVKTKATARRGSRPSPHKNQVAFHVPSSEDKADDEELAEIIRDRQQRAAGAKEIKGLSDESNAYRADWLGAKVRFVKMAESTTDENHAADENESTRADEAIPATDEIARATTSVAPEEYARPVEVSVATPEDTEQVRATASVAPEVNEPISSAPPAPMPSPILPSTSEAKKTKAAE